MLGLIIKKWTLVCIFHLLLYFDFNNISAEDTCSHTFVGQDRINISKAPLVSLEQSEPILNQNTVFKQFLKVNFLILVHLTIRLDKWDSDPVITKTGNRKTDYFTLVLMVNLHIVSYMDGLLQSKGVLIALVQVLTQVSVPYLPCAVQWSTTPLFSLIISIRHYLVVCLSGNCSLAQTQTLILYGMLDYTLVVYV